MPSPALSRARTSLLLGLALCVQLSFASGDQPAPGKPRAGHYIYGHEVNTFSPCGQADALALWVTGSEAVLQSLQALHRKHTSEPYAKLYVELEGSELPRARDGFAADYVGQFEVTEVRAAGDGEC